MRISQHGRMTVRVGRLQVFVWSLACSWMAMSCWSMATAGTAEIAKLDVYPPNIELSTRRDMQRVIAVATRTDGVTVDVTDKVAWKFADPSLVRFENFTAYPAKDGKSELTATLGGLQVKIPLVVQQATAERPISFRLDVMPIFARTGCNTGSCHGAARGKDGFRLSLFGFDPEGDYHRITREMGARRVDLAVPEKSLMIEKSIGAVPHTGGKRFDVESPYYRAMLRWLREGAPNDKEAPPKVVKIELFPPEAVIEGEGTTQRFICRAIYADGTDRDVTELAAFFSNNESSASIDLDGKVTADARGEAFILARFDVHTVGCQVLTLPKDLKYTAPEITGNYIDQLVGAKLNKLRILPSEICSDEEYLRRVTLDITGLLPTEDEYLAFLSDPEPDKRAKLVDQLLNRKEFSEIWAMKWAELLMIKTTNQVSYKASYLYSTWLTNKIANNEPIDKIVRELLSATGGTFRNPETNFYQIERNTLKTAENVAQIFMGLRTQCAQCHNHPFDRWTMDDYYSFAAFFSQIGRKTGEDYREVIVYNRGSGEVRHLGGGRTRKPKFLGAEEPDVKGKDRREVLAQWLTSPRNPFFATSIANRVWDHFFGMGIIDPVDDIRVSNPPSNPELFDTLGNKLIEYKYDFKRLVRDICTSQTYQRSVRRNESNAQDRRNFAAGTVRRIRAEMLLDCISQVTGTKDKFRGLPLGARAVQIADGRTSTYFLTTFGRARRDTVAASEVSTAPSLSQALHMLNGTTLQTKIAQGGIVKKMLEEKNAPEQVIERLYIRCLSRRPTDAERRVLLDVVKHAPNMQQGLEDVFWAVLNSREFLFNH